MLESKEQKIGESTYRVTQLGAKRGLEVFGRLFQFIAPALGGLLNEAGSVKSLEDVELSAVGTAFKEIAARQVGSELQYFVDAFLPSIEYDGGKDGNFVPLAKVYELHMAGKIHDLFQLLWFCVEVNYAGFLAGVASLRSDAEAARSKESSRSPSLAS
jgi:hypothetical protein